MQTGMDLIKSESAASIDKIHTLIENATDYVQKMHCDLTKWTPPFKCAVSPCPNTFFKYDPEYKLPFKFHNFPLSAEVRKIWIEKCKLRNDVDINFVKVCSDHFRLDDYERNFKEEFKNPNYKRKLKPDALPSRNLDGVPLPSFDLIDHSIQYGSTAPVQADFRQDPPAFDVIKPVVDANIKLREQIDKLRCEKSELAFKLRTYDKKLRSRKRDVITIRSHYEKLRKSNFTFNEQKNLLSKVFSDAQINILLGKKKVIWNDDDLAMAFTLRQMSSRECYLYLKQTLNMPLPALSCVQRWSASK